MTVWASTKLHLQSDGLVETFNRTLAEELAIVTSKCQNDVDSHLPLVLMACHSGVHVLPPSPPDVGESEQHATCNGLWPPA